MNSEEWRPVIGYEGLYEVSSLGRVRSLDRYDSNNHFYEGRILKLCADRLGYLKVGLHSNSKRKSFLVHRLVAQAFIPNPDNLPEVNHLDEDKTNNRVENLEMCDRKYNNNYGLRIDKVRDTKLKNGTWLNLNDEERKIYHNEYHKKYYQENREKICEYQREYRKKQKEQIQNNV